MTETQHEILLTGCAPTPMAAYLKALGVLRLITEQADGKATGCWAEDSFLIRCSLDKPALLEFFKERYQPTPLVGPWGARSGFYEGSSERTAREALSRIQSSSNERFTLFRGAIQAIRDILQSLHIKAKADVDSQKRELMMACRASLPDSLLPWLDATYVLLNEDTKFPPLLGTGGNEGSGSYMSGFAQQVVSVLIERNWDHALEPSLFGTTELGIGSKQTPGQFSPEAAGGANAAQGFGGGLTMNPWDYLFLLEGTLIFASASAKRLRSSDKGELSFPFCVRSSGVGYESSDFSDESSARAEMWLPLWRNHSSLAEIAALFSEGRVEVVGNQARTGVDFARAVASYGVDRGISEFTRFGFHQRNGLSFFAVPLGRFSVSAQPSVALVNSINWWLERYRRGANGKGAPSSARRVLRRVESAIMELCQRKGERRVQDVVVALGEAEAVLARSASFRENSFLPPLVLRKEWLLAMNDGSLEFRLAASLAGIWDQRIGAFREHLEPVEINGSHVRWLDDKSTRIVWGLGGLLRNLAAVLLRRTMDAVSHGPTENSDVVLFPGRSPFPVSLGDIQAFLEGRADLVRLEALLSGMALLDWARIRKERPAQWKRGPAEPVPSAVYALLKLTHLPFPLFQSKESPGIPIRLTPSITRLVAASRISEAIQAASRRLLGAGVPQIIDTAMHPAGQTDLLVASLLFPIASRDAENLAQRVTDTSGAEEGSADEKSLTEV